MLTWIALILMLVWLALLTRAAVYGNAIKNLLDEPVAIGSPSPRLSIILSARDEHDALRHALPKLLSTNYPNAEFILVDDRSTDGTGPLLDSFAAKDPRVRAIHIEKLPPDWLGKVNALNEAVKVATGEWLLFTDADILFGEEVLTRSVAYAEEYLLDQLVLIPETVEHRQDLLLNAFETAFGALFVQTFYEPNLRDPSKRDYVGVGAFNLIRRSTYDQTPGLEWLRMEVLDDVGIGLLIKNAGGRCGALYGRKLLYFEWYPTIRTMLKGLEKNTFGGFGAYSFPRVILLLVGLMAAVIGPLLIALLAWKPILLAIVVCIYFMIPWLTAHALYGRLKMKPSVIAALPAGFLLLIYAIFKSAFEAWKRGGIEWRGTVYPLETLRRMRRVML